VIPPACAQADDRLEPSCSVPLSLAQPYPRACQLMAVWPAARAGVPGGPDLCAGGVAVQHARAGDAAGVRERGRGPAAGLPAAADVHVGVRGRPLPRAGPARRRVPRVKQQGGRLADRSACVSMSVPCGACRCVVSVTGERVAVTWFVDAQRPCIGVDSGLAAQRSALPLIASSGSAARAGTWRR